MLAPLLQERGWGEVGQKERCWGQVNQEERCWGEVCQKEMLGRGRWRGDVVVRWVERRGWGEVDQVEGWER